MNEEMSGGAKRSPLDLLVLPQPVDFFSKKIDKITKNFNEWARPRHFAILAIFLFFHQLIHWMSGRTGRRISRERRESRRLFRLEVGLIRVVVRRFAPSKDADAYPPPTFELTGALRRGTLAARCSMNLGASRPGCHAVAGPVERRVRHRCALCGGRVSWPSAPMASHRTCAPQAAP